MTAPAGDRFVTGLTDDQLKAVETMAEDLMIEILTQVADHYADLLVERATKAGALVAAADDAVPPGAGEGAFVDPQDLAGISGATSAAIAAEMVPLVAEVYLSGAARIRAEMIDATGLTLPPIRSVDALNYLANSANTFDEIGDDLWGAVRSELAAGFDAGEGIPQLAERVRSAAGVTSRTATLTARTSVIDAANMGSISTAKASGLEMEKEWMATPDRRTRPTHRTADGQRVDLHGKFIVGGFEADYPADPSLPSQERRLCRCTIGYVIPDESVSKLRPEARAEVLAPTTLPRQRQAPVAAATRGPDPALKMTVAQLKDAAAAHDKANGTRFLSLLIGQKKAQMVDTLRDLERAHSTKIAGLPPAPRIVVAPAPVTPQLGQPAGLPLTGNPADKWWQELRATTGPNGVPVRNFRVVWSTHGDYRVAHGTAWRDADGAAYLIEHGAYEASAQWVAKALAEMRAAHAQIPAAGKANKAYAWLLERNPSDPYWATQYKMPDFRSYATAGDGGVNLWSRSLYRTVEIGSLRHETGHNLDRLVGKQVQGSESKAWEAAAAADAKSPAVFVTRTTTGEPIHPVTQHTDNSKNYPNGVSDYGKSSPAEDYAEAVRLYQLDDFALGSIGDIDAPEVPVYFRDLFPNRAAMLDGLFPDIARAQKAAIKLRDAKVTVPKVAETPGAAAKRAAARARQAAIDKAQMRAGALNEIDEVVGVSADPLILQNRLEYLTSRKDLTKAEAATIAKAAATGDRSKMTAALGRLAAKSRLTITAERAGDIIDFDPMRMQSVGALGAQLSAGVKVRVMRGGAEFDYDGDRVELEKILVRPTTRDELRRVREAKADSARELAGFASILERDKLGMSGAEIRTQLARSNMSTASRIALEKVADDPIKLKRAIAAELRKTKIRPEGKPAAAGVAYDPETMATLGGVEVPAGVKVRIVERGYSVDVDGERVVLVRAFVEPIVPKPKKIAKAAAARKTPGGALTGTDALESAPWSLGDRTGEVADAVRKYRASAYVSINKALRSGKLTPATRALIGRIDEAMDQSALPNDVIVWRGDDGGYLPAGNADGFEWTDEGFLSTTVTQANAEKYGGTILRIVTPSGTKALKLSELGGRKEGEMLLQRGLRLRVMRDAGRVDGVRRVDVEIVPAPTSVRAGRAAPAYTPPASVSATDQKRAAALVKRDPQIMATVQERFGGISTSGNLSQADAAWLDALAKREPAFVERLAQTTRIEEDLRRAAKAAGMTPAKLRDAIAARLREIFDGKPVGVRVGSETVLRSILSGGRFKTQFDGAKRNGHLVASQEKRRLFEQTLGVDPGADLEVRPVYGYVMPNGVEPARMPDGRQMDLLSTYGEIQVVLKSSVRPRTTATIGDSLDRMFMVQPSPIDDPSALSAGLSYSWKIDRLEEVFTQEFRRGNYIEAQIHGGVVVDDIAEVVFPSQPDATTVKALADAGIPWRVLERPA